MMATSSRDPGPRRLVQQQHRRIRHERPAPGRSVAARRRRCRPVSVRAGARCGTIRRSPALAFTAGRRDRGAPGRRPGSADRQVRKQGGGVGTRSRRSAAARARRCRASNRTASVRRRRFVRGRAQQAGDARSSVVFPIGCAEEHRDARRRGEVHIDRETVGPAASGWTPTGSSKGRDRPRFPDQRVDEGEHREGEQQQQRRPVGRGVVEGLHLVVESRSTRSA